MKTKMLIAAIAVLLLKTTNISSQNASYDLNNALGGTGIAGTDGSAFGNGCLVANTTGVNNTAVGHDALSVNTTNGGNTGLGKSALASNLGGDFNTATGAFALNSNSTGDRNSTVGYSSLNNNTGGGSNTAVGYNSLSSANADYNVAIGYESFLNSTTGNRNTLLGSDTDLNGVGTWSNSSAVGNGVIVVGLDQVRLGDVNVQGVFTQSGNYSASDARFKININEEDVKGLQFIKGLRPVAYNFDTKKLQTHITQGMPESQRQKHLEKDFTRSSAIRRSGFLAQEVLQTAKDAGYDFNGVYQPQSQGDYFALDYSQFVVPLVKAMQEQQVMIENLQREIERIQKPPVWQQDAKKITSDQIRYSEGIKYSLEQNEPNPFTAETVIKYKLPVNVYAAILAVYDLSGKQIATFNLSTDTESSITITSEKLNAGIYIYSIFADGRFIESKRMIVAEK